MTTEISNPRAAGMKPRRFGFRGPDRSKGIVPEHDPGAREFSDLAFTDNGVLDRWADASKWVADQTVARASRRERRCRAAEIRETRRLQLIALAQPLFTKTPFPKERLRVDNWIIQRLYDHAVKDVVKLQLLAVFQHVVDPTGSSVTPFDLRPTVAD